MARNKISDNTMDDVYGKFGVDDKEKQSAESITEPTTDKTGAERNKRKEKLHRINTGYSLENYDFIYIEGRKQGMWPSEFVNKIIDEYREKFEKRR